MNRNFEMYKIYKSIGGMIPISINPIENNELFIEPHITYTMKNCNNKGCKGTMILKPFEKPYIKGATGYYFIKYDQSKSFLGRMLLTGETDYETYFICDKCNNTEYIQKHQLKPL